MSESTSSELRRLVSISGAIIVLVGFTGLTSGRFTGTAHEELIRDRASRALASLPDTCGHWTSTSLEMNPDELKVAEVSGAILRRYTHRDSRDSVIVLALCGPPGPISVHPPTACYRARGYRLVRQPQTTAIDGANNTVITAEFENPAGFREDRVGILWCWSDGENWSAPENPRLEFASEPALFKLYVTWDRCQRRDTLEESIPKQFFKDFAATFRQHFPLDKSK